MKDLFFMDAQLKAVPANSPDEVSDEDLAAINSLKVNGPLRTLKKEDVRVRAMYILGEEPTSKMSIHPEGELNGKKLGILSEISRKTPGAPMMEGHRFDKIGWGRIFRSSVERGVAGYKGAVQKIQYFFLRGFERYEQIAKEIDAGIRAEGSISYWFREARCSICHKPIATWSLFGSTNGRCTIHRIGQKDPETGQVCYWYPVGMQMVGEVSHVFRGAYRKTKSLLTAVCPSENGIIAAYGEDEIKAAKVLESQLVEGGLIIDTLTQEVQHDSNKGENEGGESDRPHSENGGTPDGDRGTSGEPGDGEGTQGGEEGCNQNSGNGAGESGQTGNDGENGDESDGNRAETAENAPETREEEPQQEEVHQPENHEGPKEGKPEHDEEDAQNGAGNQENGAREPESRNLNGAETDGDDTEHSHVSCSKSNSTESLIDSLDEGLDRDEVEECLREHGVEDVTALSKAYVEKWETSRVGQKKVLDCVECGHQVELDGGGSESMCPECQGELEAVSMIAAFKPVGPVKPAKSGSQNNEFFKKEGFKELADGEYQVEGKYDGVYMELHRKGDEVKLYTDEGNEHSEKFPGIVDEAKKLKQDNFIVCGEMVKYRNRKRLRHEDVTSWLQSKKETWNDKPFRFKPYDVVMMEGEDLRKKSLADRRGKMIDGGAQIHPTSFIRVKHSKGEDKIVSAIEDRATREGSMVKNLESRYTKAGSKSLFKWKRQYEIDARVVAKKERDGGGFVYSCEVGPEGKGISIGDTYTTKIDAAKGDILTVSVDRVTKHEDGHYTWTAPKVIAVRKGKKSADPVSVVERIAEKVSNDATRDSNVVLLGEVVPVLKGLSRDYDMWLVGGIVEHGMSTHDIDLLTRSELGEDERGRIQDALGINGRYADFLVDQNGPAGPSLKLDVDMDRESNSWKYAGKFVVQRHGWGKKEHWDLRFGAPRTERMWGFTIFSEPSKKEGGPKSRCQEKKYHDPKWMDVDTKKIEPGEPGNPTKKLNAWMIKVDGGEYDFIRRKPGFLEVVLHGKTYKGRYLFREITVKPRSKKDRLSVDGDEVEPKNDKIWIMWKPKDQSIKGQVMRMALTPIGCSGVLGLWETDEVDTDIENAADEPME